ncbi:MAG: hypothetical protein CMF96_07750 [Candidatus Marinimicrobia bacterium]|nr:hypothetical protein [Candidatus Neomarinimicrobiota bacterium]|tara:strand:+ start:491 stop:1018 length:528 start_codon:yes stop_codon:yes gene_type:complete
MNNLLFLIICLSLFSCDITKSKDCAGIQGGSAIIDACGICTEGTTGLNANYLMNCMGECSSTILEENCIQTIPIYYNSSVEITGFQFQIIGDINILENIAGDAQNSGFTVTTGNNIVIGFSLLGENIEAGNGLLTSLKYEGSSNEYCLSELIVTSLNATIVDAEILNCNTIFHGN